jgi:hypothetical protein
MNINRWMAATIASLGSVMIAGCGSPMLKVKDPPPVEAGASAEITIARQATSSMARQWVVLNGDVVAHLGGKEYTTLKVKPGRHSVGVVCFYPSHYFDQLFSPFGASNNGETYMEIELGAGERTCLQSSVGFFSCAEKQPQACESIDEYKFSEPGKAPRE